VCSVRDVFAFFISLAIVFSVILLSKILEEKKVASRDFMREFTHIVMGSWGVIWILFDTKVAATTLTLVITLFLIFAPSKMKKIYSGGEEKHIGLILYATMFTVVTFLFWNTRIGSLAIFTLAFSDGTAGIIGKKYGKHKYELLWTQTRSLEGSLGFYIGSIISWILAWLIYGGALLPVFMFIYSLILMVTEALSPPHTDNVIIPIVSVVMGLLIGL